MADKSMDHRTEKEGVRMNIAPTPAKLGWRESYAYTQGMQAFVFGFPWVFLPELRWKWVTQDPHSAGVPYLPLNQFWNLRQLATTEYRDGSTPNKSKDTPRHPQRHG
jgi:hypothetical protein